MVTPAAWVSFRRGHGKPLSYAAFESSVRAIGRTLGIHVHAHLFRHTLAQSVLETTGNLKVTQELLGHAHLSTTAEQYARVDQQALVEAVAAARTAFNRAAEKALEGEGGSRSAQHYAFAYDQLTIEELDGVAVHQSANDERSAS
jgi:integrase/recombinase XerD